MRHLKVLVIRFSSIGDIALTTSFLRSVKTKYNHAEIHFLTLNRFSPILEMQPDIDRVIVLNDSTGFYELIQFNKYIKSSEYDVIFDLHGSIRSRIVTLGLNEIVSRVKKPRLSRSILFQLHLNIFPKDFSTSMMYHQCLEEYNKSNIPKTLLRVSNLEQKFARAVLKKIGIEGNYIVLIPGAQWSQKQWHVEKYNVVIDRITSATGKKIIMLGTKKDRICKNISMVNSNVIDYSGATDIREAMAIISLSDTVFGSDTGLLHIAEALGKHVTMILGPTSVETGGGVSLGDSINIESDIWCRPCSQNGKQKCFRSSQFCMDLISEEKVTSSVIERV